MIQTLSDRLTAVKDRIRAAAVRAGRDASEVTLVAVSKTHPASAVLEAVAAGQTVFGENKIQEAEWKRPEVGAGTWHLIGHLQSNKARKAVKVFDVIESVDSLGLAERLERICGEEGRERLPVFIQVDLAGEETKSGASESDLPAIVDFVRTSAHLELRGLMTIPPFLDDAEEVRPYFKRLRELRDALVPGGGLSMGMSHDFEVAVEEGATLVRVGTAVFGERKYGREG
jgi:pyridoxal phosphate enzyme (YggS family)